MGSYTAAASLSGVLGLFFLDRFDRRKALVVTLFGLALGTFVGGLSTSFVTLTMTRVLAGIFGGPATSLTMAILADAVPAKRRGRAMGVVMGGFAVASVLGVPAGLWLAALGGWQVPFFAVGLVILGAAVAALRVLPPLADHLALAQEPALPALSRLLRSPTVRISLLLTTITMMSGFILIPNIASFAEFNQGFPNEHLGWMYLLGGVASMVTTRVAGRMIDVSSAAKVSIGATVILAAVTWTWFGSGMQVPILVVSTIFFVAMGARGVAYNTTTSKVAAPEERARFQSLQSAVQHAAAALAAFTSSKLLSEQADKSLAHMDRVAAVSIGFSILVPLVMHLVERGIRTRSAASPPLEGGVVS
jgi:predicted MFS family arabinose efflux permease